MSNIRIEFNGLPRIVVDGVVHALSPRDAAMLVWLAIEGATSRDRILELLWPSVGRVKAQGHLRQNLRRLKGRCDGRDVVLGDSVLQLAASVERSVDDDDFDLGDEALLRPPDPPVLGDALTEDWPDFDRWLKALRERRTAERRRRIEQRIAELEQRDDFDDALRFADRLIADDAADEEAYRHSMWLHFRRGDLASARSAFDACRSALSRARSAAPGAKTMALRETIERGEPSPVSTFVVPPNLVRPPRLVGREDVCRAIDAAWQVGQPVLLLGDPGLGKTRLLTHFAHGRGIGVSPVAARRGDAGVAYSLLGRLLGALARAFGEPPDWARERLVGIVASWGDASSSPVTTTLQLRQAVDAALDEWTDRGLRALVLDDLQYADDSSLEWLVHCAGRGAAAPLRLLLATRVEPLPQTLAAWRAGSGCSRTVVVELSPLDPGEVAELLDDLELPGLDGQRWAAPLHALCGGVPFELLSTLIALQSRGVLDFSDGLEALLGGKAPLPDATLARLRRLPDEAQRLAQVAAIAGQAFEVDLAAELMGAPSVAIATPWRALEQAGVFRGAGYAHDLVMQAVEASIPDAVARSLHRQIAEWLSPRIPGADAARIAAHWESAHCWAEAARSFEAAADAARSRAARREELQALSAALRCHRRAVPGGSAEAFACACRQVRLMPGLQPLDEALVAANALVEAAGSDEDCAAALEARAVLHGERHDSEAALADALAAMRLAGMARLRLLASLQAARSLVRLNRHDEALRLLDVPPGALAALDPDDEVRWWSETGTVLDYADRRTEAIATFERAIEQGRAAGLWDAVNAALNDKAIALLHANRLVDSTAALREGLACGRRAGYDDDGLLLDTMTLAGNLRDLGRFDEALASAESLPVRMRRAGYAAWSFMAENDLAGLFLWLGRLELATRALTPLADDAPDAIRASRLFVQSRLLRESQSADFERRAAALVQEAARLLTASGGAGRSYVRLKVALELARDEDDPVAGANKAARIEAEAEDREQRMLVLHARMLRVKLLLAGGRPDAAAHAARGLAEVEEAGALYLPEVWWTASRALATTDAVLADRCVDRANAWIDRVVERHVPPVFRTSFLTRNPINRAVRAAAARRR